MYEEDRVRVLELYNEIFDETDNETALLQILVSPTRQAVNLARAYDAKDRGVQESGVTPSYMQVIDQLRSQAQSLFPVLLKTELENTGKKDEPSPDTADNLPELIFSAVDEPSERSLPVSEPEEITRFPDEDSSRAGAPQPAPPTAAPAEKESAPAGDVDDFADAVEAFLADFTITDESLENGSATLKKPTDITRNDVPGWASPAAAVEEAEAPAEPSPEAAQEPPAAEAQPAAAPEQPAAAQAKPAEEKAQSTGAHRIALEDLPSLPAMTERKANVPLLILFILIAVPVGLLCIGFLVSAALVLLSVGAAMLTAAVIGFSTAFAAFSVFADILLVFGLSLAAAAFCLLFFWLFVWILFGLIPDLVRGIIALAGKLCYKEVAA